MYKLKNNRYEAIVIGAGHAGVEAANALAVRGHKTLILSLSLDGISNMACNPNIGGTGKAHLVKEVDALGGLMGEVADVATIQSRTLNSANGPAVHSLRAQVDKKLYQRTMKKRLEEIENLDILEGEAKQILVDENKKVCGIETGLGAKYYADAVILATGVYLNSRIIIGDHSENTGPSGLKGSTLLTQNLLDLGLDIRRFKTGTPPRLLASSIDFSKMEIQEGHFGNPKFSNMTDFDIRNDHPCYLTYTTEESHKIILDNLDRSPLFNGDIRGTGTRYCPSVEDKIVKFRDKERHQVFIEPEGADTHEMYAQGLSTSLPFDVQEALVRSVPGLENAKITRYGYGIEYDCINPLELLPSLGLKKYKGLFAAGQINGTSGYEEAAAQGLIAGINASKQMRGEEPFILRRDQAYIGVLIDDLTTKGTNEPYRMMTSRAEHRLYLRQDNADLRLTEIGRELGLVKDERYKRYLEKEKELKEIRKSLSEKYKVKDIEYIFERRGETLPKTEGVLARDMLRRNYITSEDIREISPTFASFSPENVKIIETELKYEGYLRKQKRAIKESMRLESLKLPEDMDYMNIDGLRIEARQKLNRVKPLTVAQAERISGVNPADITVLLLYMRKKNAKTKVDDFSSEETEDK
ncbi:MAG: tRNA uridine-5-carboxymethylaminomethyl(34) synthesis enzyme MnmG [Clostridiales bacterium]|jgi:tRNA uridine 5-carboxymethylaminomethyl modification enzyme|nr:tRNA uridine-5-carboxymethylaminomethyl(34) synthesis enzyme MnmG [Clostridiales bacterium]